jgi:hypothetical protein
MTRAGRLAAIVLLSFAALVGGASAAPEQASLALRLGVHDVNDGSSNGPDVDVDGVKRGDRVTMRLDVASGGDRDATAVEIWHPLPSGISCDMVPARSVSGSCELGRVSWSGLTVAAGATRTLTFDITLPDSYGPGYAIQARAGVRSYRSTTEGGVQTTHVPADNVDVGHVPGANTPAASDAARLAVKDFSSGLTATTRVIGSDNAAAEATPGEKVSYAVSFTMPQGTTLHGSPRVSVPLGDCRTLVSSSVVVKVAGAVVSAGYYTTASNTIDIPTPLGFVYATSATQATTPSSSPTTRSSTTSPPIRGPAPT